MHIRSLAKFGIVAASALIVAYSALMRKDNVGNEFSVYYSYNPGGGIYDVVKETKQLGPDGFEEYMKVEVYQDYDFDGRPDYYSMQIAETSDRFRVAEDNTLIRFGYDLPFRQPQVATDVNGNKTFIFPTPYPRGTFVNSRENFTDRIMTPKEERDTETRFRDVLSHLPKNDLIWLK